MIGETIGQYHIIDKIGEGGMGAVWKAEDTSLGRLVALKTLSPHLATNEEARERFVREARAASSLNHPNITVVHELVRDDDSHLICMEYVEGKTIRDMLESGRISVKKAVSITLQVAEALEAAHRQQILHRDIKSANIMVTMEGRVKVMDFGLAHLGERSQLTRTGTMMGTLAYTCPEQIAGRPYDARSEIWSLGVVFYEMLAGHLPFEAGNEAELIFGIINNEPAPLHEMREDVNVLVEGVIGRMLEKDPLQRYQSMGELAGDLTALHRDLETGSTSAIRAFEYIKKRRRTQNIARVAAGVIVGLAIVIGAGLLLFPSRPADAGPPSIAILPLQNETTDAGLDYLGRNLASELTDEVIRSGISGRLDVVENDRLNRVYEDLLTSRKRREREDPVRASALRTQAGLAVSGSYRRVGQSEEIEIRLRIRNISTTGIIGLEDQISLSPVRGTLQEPDALGETLSDRLLGALAFYLDERFRFLTGDISPPPSLEIYRLFRDGVDYTNANQCLEAGQLDSAYTAPLVWAALLTTGMSRVGLESAVFDSLMAVLIELRETNRLQRSEPLLVEYIELWRDNASPRDRFFKQMEIADQAPWSKFTSYAGFTGAEANYLQDAADFMGTCLQTVCENPEIFETDPDRTLPLQGPWTTLSDYCNTLWALREYRTALAVAREFRAGAAVSSQDSLWADACEIMALVMVGKTRQAMDMLRECVEEQRYTHQNWWVVFRDLPLKLRLVDAEDRNIEEVLRYGLDFFESLPDPTADDKVLWKAQLYYVCGHFEEARAVFNDLMSRQLSAWQRFNSLRYLGCIAARLGENDRAREFGQSLEEEFGTDVTLAARARIVARMGETDTAALLLSEAFDSGIKYPWLSYPWGEFSWDFESLEKERNRIYLDLMRPKK